MGKDLTSAHGNWAMTLIPLIAATAIALITVLGYAKIPHNDAMKLVAYFLIAASIPEGLTKMKQL